MTQEFEKTLNKLTKEQQQVVLKCFYKMSLLRVFFDFIYGDNNENKMQKN